MLLARLHFVLTFACSGRRVRPTRLSEEQFPADRNAAPPEAKGYQPRFGVEPTGKLTLAFRAANLSRYVCERSRFLLLLVS